MPGSHDEVRERMDAYLARGNPTGKHGNICRSYQPGEAIAPADSRSAMSAATERPGTVLQAWVPVELADQVKQEAEAERRSVSAVVRHLIEDNFATVAAKADSASASGGFLTRSRSGAGQGGGLSDGYARDR